MRVSTPVPGRVRPLGRSRYPESGCVVNESIERREVARSERPAMTSMVAVGRRTGNRDDVHQLPRDRIDAVRPWFTPELPGPVIFAHIRHSGVGRCLVDRWPEPRVVLAQTSGNYAIRGNPDALDNSALDDLAGFVEAPSAWEPMLRRIDPGLAIWNRVVAVLPAVASAPPPDPRVRRLTASDTEAVGQLHTKLSWISDPGAALPGLPRPGWRGRPSMPAPRSPSRCHSSSGTDLRTSAW